MNTLRHAITAALAISALTLANAPAVASTAPPEGPPDYTVEFPAGLACSNFGLRLEGWAGTGQYRELKDRNGYLRLAFAGTGEAWRLTNMLNGKSIATRNNGASALIQVYQADGSVKVDARGHSLIIWFPSDLPPGPSSTLLSGQLVYSLSPAGQGSLGSMKGNATDVCVALS